jgi:hypothetical protein
MATRKAARKPAAKRPAAKRPAAKRPAIKKPAPRKATTKRKPARTATPRKAAPTGPADDLMKLAGVGSESVMKATGKAWEDWLKVLDKAGAVSMPHKQIAELLSNKFDVPGWWSQMVTVGYERIKGIRARGQRRNGSYEASKSRTFDVPVTKLFDAWAKAPVRRRWLDGADVKVRTATSPKSMRLDWADGGIVAVWFQSKGKSKSVVALAHTKLPDKATADRLKKYWSARLDALSGVLSERKAAKPKA